MLPPVPVEGPSPRAARGGRTIRRPGTFGSIALLIILLVAPAHAQECTPTTSAAPEVDVAGERYYLIVDPSLCPGCPVGVHVIVYEETNGIAGLQRQDERHDDTCKGLIRPDAPLKPA